MSSDLKPVDPIDECVQISRELARVQDEYKEMLDEAVVVERERNALKRENAELRKTLLLITQKHESISELFTSYEDCAANLAATASAALKKLQ